MPSNFFFISSGEKTVAILAPNLMGNICDWEKIRLIANKYNLIVIEDSADTLGATLNGYSSFTVNGSTTKCSDTGIIVAATSIGGGS